MNKSTYSRPVNFVVLSRQQLMLGVIYVVPRCSHDGAVTDLLAVMYVRIWWYSARAVGCVRQHCRTKHCNGFCGAHKCVWPGAGVEDQHLTTLLSWDKLYTKAIIRTSACCNITAEFYYYSLGKKFTISLFLSSQKAIDRNRDAIGNFFLLGGIVWRNYVDCHSDSGSEFEPSSQSLWQSSIGSSLLHRHFSAKDQWEMISFPLCMPQSALMVHQENVTCNSQTLQCMTPGFRREVGENWPLLCYYAASSGNYLPTFCYWILDPRRWGR
jgi:hypothetical protein